MRAPRSRKNEPKTKAKAVGMPAGTLRKIKGVVEAAWVKERDDRRSIAP